MSDGDNAALGRRGMPGSSAASSDNSNNPWLTRSPRPSSTAAPWEREAQSTPGNSSGNGATVTVADLIAKVSAESGRPPSHRANAEQAAPARENRHDSLQDPVTEPLPRAPQRPRQSELTASELPDLTARALRDWADGATTQLPAADAPVPPGTAESFPAPRRKRRVIFAGRSVAAAVALLTLAMTGGGWQWTNAKNNRLNHVSALDPTSQDIVDPAAQYGDENFLIAGVDSRMGANGEVGAGTTQDAAGIRSDTVILVNIPASRKRVVAVSFPRDLAITPLQCQAWNSDTGQYGPIHDDQAGTFGPDQIISETKLNSTYAFGGPKCLVKEIQKLSGLAINHFIAVDFVGFEKMVDAVGGVEVCSKTPLQDYELGTVLDHAGRQTLDGKTALNYVRARQVTTEFNGDYGRIKRQQMFLSSLLRSFISKEVLLNPGRLDDAVNTFLANTYVDNIQTKDLANLGQSLQSVAAGRVTFMTVPTTGETDADGNEPLRVDDTHAIFTAIINDEPLPEENNENATATPTTAAATPDAGTITPTAQPGPPAGGNELVDAVTTAPAEVTVHVSNSTGQTGLATTAADQLEQHGFHVLSPDDYPNSLPSTTVIYAPGNEQAAATVASSFADPQMQRATGMGDVVQVVLGPDFRAVNAPPPSGSPVRVHVAHDTPAAPPTKLPDDLTVTNAADTSCK